MRNACIIWLNDLKSKVDLDLDGYKKSLETSMSNRNEFTDEEIVNLTCDVSRLLKKSASIHKCIEWLQTEHDEPCVFDILSNQSTPTRYSVPNFNKSCKHDSAIECDCGSEYQLCRHGKKLVND